MVGVGDICQKQTVGKKRAKGREKERSESGGHLSGCIFQQRPGFLDCPTQKLKARSRAHLNGNSAEQTWEPVLGQQVGVNRTLPLLDPATET